jgi:methionyl-tRNA formyltransferase
VPIGPDDSAADVFARVTGAAEIVIRRSLPTLIDGSAVLRTQDLAAGSYFGGRKPEDGRIEWRKGAQAVHNLVRAVAPPYPGAFTDLGGATLQIHKTRLLAGKVPLAAVPAMLVAPQTGQVTAVCADSSALALLAMQLDGKPFTAAQFLSRFGPDPITLPVS